MGFFFLDKSGIPVLGLVHTQSFRGRCLLIGQFWKCCFVSECKSVQNCMGHLNHTPKSAGKLFKLFAGVRGNLLVSHAQDRG